jgi:murein DD-endopeptidase MepM/ murein hydrolase activator NlpD
VKRILFIASLGALLWLPCPGVVAAPQYPEVRVLSHDDPLFVQQQAELDEFRRLAEAHTPDMPVFPALSLFAYTKRQTEDLFSLNARLGLRYESLATLNGSASKDIFNARTKILIPSQDGLFISTPPRGDLETMMLSTRISAGKKPLVLQISRDGKQEPLYFFPADSFTSVERAYFLRILYRSPIDKGHITSMYGWRKDPFTGSPEFHTGLDIGAAEGTPVYAAREGVVDEAGTNETLGNFVVITHPGGYQTVYGHLSTISATIHQRVSTGAMIGAVGHTGMATGPHLHFEVRTKKGTTDPLAVIRMNQG